MSESVSRRRHLDANTVFTVRILGVSSGTALFLAPCTVLAAFSFRRAAQARRNTEAA